ncbi:MAG: ydgH 4 [Pseudonocardia sp.]|nr:ydgH 4 [Pseudonocardia sp.]
MFHRIGTFVVRRARLVLIVALLAVIGGGVVGAGAFSKLGAGGFEDQGSQSWLARDRIIAQFGGEPNLVFLVTSKSGSVDAPAAVAAGTRLSAELDAEPSVTQIVSYWATKAPSLKSSDGASALVMVSTTQSDAKDLVPRYSTDNADVTVQVGGAFGVYTDVQKQLGADLGLAESIAIPLTMVLLVLAFGSVVAALLTLLIGIVAILGTFAELSVFASLTDVSIYAVNLTVGLGLGLAVDYGLLMVSRFREERSKGLDTDAAVVRAVETAGRTIVFSAATVATALAALVVFPLYFLRSMAYGGVGVVAIAAISAVFLLPALLAVLGPRADAWRLPWAKKLPGTEAPFWGRLAGVVMRRPLLTALPVLIGLLLLASPLLDVRFGTPDDRVLTTSAASRQVGDTLRSGFGADDSNALHVVTSSGVAAPAVTDYATTLSRLPEVERVDSSVGTFVRGNPVGTTPANATLGRPDAQQLSVVTKLDNKSDRAQQLVREVRAVPGPSGTDVLVGGQAAVLVDTKDAIGSKLPLAAGLIVITTFILLFLFTGSVVQPIRSLLLTVVSLSATLGAMVWVFQQGHLSGLLGFTPMPLDTGMVVLLFCIAFGLSMDYEVFVLSRIKEMHDTGADTREAVVHGLARSGRIVTTAAALIAVSFFAFLISKVSLIQLFGLGAGLAILIDATLVRGVLVPAAMRVLGEFAWWAPRPLRRLHAKIGLSDDAPPVREPVGAAR